MRQSIFQRRNYIRTQRRQAILFLSLVALVVGTVPARALAGPLVWVAPSLERVGREQAAGIITGAEIWAARGEYESFQIVVRAPASGLTGVNATVSNLTGPAGGVIPSTNVTLYREHYVHVNRSSPDWRGRNRPLGPGWYPDGLIPFRDPVSGRDLEGAMLDAVPFSLAADRNQPIWVDVFVPRNAPPGLYTGTYTVSSDQGETSGIITLHVWNFTLPRQPALHSSFGFWKAGSVTAKEELLRNRLAPETVPRQEERRLAGDLGLGATDLGYWSGADVGQCSMSTPPGVSELKAAARRHQPGILLYNYTADEIDDCPNLFPTMRQWAGNLHRAGVLNLVTMAPVPDLYDDGSGTGRSAVDIWAVLPVMYDSSIGAVQHVLKKGDAVWSYNTLVQDDYSPKWEIDFAPINYRIQPGFINESLGLSGLLYWRVDYWKSDAWNNVNNSGEFSEANYPGEGMLVYPGSPVGITGVAPSMRLKWLRDGVDDYDYIELLKKQGKGAWALDQARLVGPDWVSWTRETSELEAVRRALGVELDRLAGGSPAPEPPAAPAGPQPADGATGPAPVTPATPTVMPNASRGWAQTFEVRYPIPAGTANLAGGYILFANQVDGRNACWVYYERLTDRIWLASNNTNTWRHIPMRSSRRLGNRQCVVYARGSSARTQNGSLVVALKLRFRRSFRGTKTIYLLGDAGNGQEADYQAAGTWTVSGAGSIRASSNSAHRGSEPMIRPSEARASR